MSQKEKKNEMVNLYGVLKEVENEKASIRFSYAAAKNIKAIEVEVNALQKIIQTPVEGGEEYEKERLEVLKKYAEKDEKGKPILYNNQYKILPENMDHFNAEMKQLEEKHKDAIDRLKERNKELEKLLQEEIEIPLQMVTLDELPQELTPLQVEMLMPMIKND